MRLVLIRHGQTPSNVRGLLDTDPPGPGLTELGLTQAATVPDVVLSDPTNDLVEVVYASTAVRAQLTAAPLAQRLGLEIIVRPGLREIAAGNWEMLDDDDSVHGYLGVIGRWMAGDLDDRTPGPTGESGREVLRRYDSVIAEISSSGVAAAAVVAHGAVNRLWASIRSVNLDDEFGARNPLRNTGIVELSGSVDQGWRVLSWTGAELPGEPAGAATEPGASAAFAEPTVVDEDPFDEAIPLGDHP